MRNRLIEGGLVLQFDKARQLLGRFKPDAYLFGPGVLRQIGACVRRTGTRAALVRGTFGSSDECVAAMRRSFAESGVVLAVEVKGARPNSPVEDVLRIRDELARARPDVVVSFGGGSTIDAVKVAEVLRTAGGDLDAYFGTGQVTAALGRSGRRLTAHIAVQTVAGSAAHLTKYANVTDLSTGQKKLIVDDAIIPAHPVFDYSLTRTASPDLTADGAFDGISHMLEVLYGAVGKPHYTRAAEILAAGLPLALQYLPIAMEKPQDTQAREALCLATDLGGYSIMVGGTNGGHLTSFSLVDVLSHGRACALMNPYYTVFFAPAIEEPLRLVGGIYRDLGLTDTDFSRVQGRDLGMEVARTMIAFARKVGFPTRLADVPGFSQVHIERALKAAQSPQLRMKLENMPVPMRPETVETYMRPILDAAQAGDLSGIRSAP
jgi:alcohol dehydrogenase